MINLPADFLKAEVILQKGIKIVFFLIVGEIIKRSISFTTRKIIHLPRKISQKISKQQKSRFKTLRSLTVNTVKMTINFIILIMILSELGVNIVPLLAGASILGLAVGFGSRSLVEDLISGFFIVLENQFNVGDEIEIGGHRGKVTKISLRTITLRDEKKNVYIIPNSSIKTVVKFPQKKKG